MKIANKFMTKEMIGHGSFGSIYSGFNLYSNDQVAIKFETSVNMKQKLFREFRIYKVISGAPGFPSLKHYGTEGDTAAMVIDLLGKNVSTLFEECKRCFSLKTVLMIADQMITRLEYLHKKSIIHRDIKPENMAIGCSKCNNIVYLIDFGLAKSYCDMKTHIHNEFKTVPFLVGTPLYASINSMKNMEQSRRDDLESLAYVLIMLLKGSLPWDKTIANNLKEVQEKILSVKENTSIEELCNGLPSEFADFLTSVRNLEFEEEPKYREYRKMFYKLFKKNGYIYDYKYDWTEKGQIFHVNSHDEIRDFAKPSNNINNNFVLMKQAVSKTSSQIVRDSKFDFTSLAKKKKNTTLKIFS